MNYRYWYFTIYYVYYKIVQVQVSVKEINKLD